MAAFTRHGGFKMLDNGCSWYETNSLGGCLRLPSPRPECLAAAERAGSSHTHGRSSRAGSHSLAIVMPYRGAGGVADLRDLCANLPPHLRSHGVRHRLHLVRQVDGGLFNRGALVNAAVRVLVHGHGSAQPHRPVPRFDYLAVHDIDRFPLRGGACANATSQYYVFPEPRPRALHPTSFAGGVLVVQLAQFEGANGFSNEYWGWGEEDNDLFLRLRWCGWAPQHAAELEACMEHRDCTQCAKQKAAVEPGRLRAHTERVRGQLERPAQHLQAGYDGLFTVNFSLRQRSHAKCGDAVVNVLSVELHPRRGEG